MSFHATRRWLFVGVASQHRVDAYTTDGSLVSSFGGYGAQDGQFKLPMGVAVDSELDLVFVTDCYNHRVQTFRSDGTFVRKWGSGLSPDGLFAAPVGIAVDSTTHLVYVADLGRSRVEVFSARTGGFVRSFGGDREGSGKNDLTSPFDVAVLPAEQLAFVSDRLNNRVSVYRTTDGVFVRSFTKPDLEVPNINWRPSGLTAVPPDRVYVVSDSARSLSLFLSDGSYQRDVPCRDYQPLGLAADPQSDELYVAERDQLNFDKDQMMPSRVSVYVDW